MKRFIVFGILACLAMPFTEAAGPQLPNLPVEPTYYRFAPSPQVWPANHGDAVVCWWEDDKTAAVSITIDDNHVGEHSYWISQGQRTGFKFTWFVITGVVDQAGWSSFRNLFALGHDVQSHTVNHYLDGDTRPVSVMETEYAGAIQAVEQNVPGSRCLTLAYPGGLGIYSVAAQYYAACRGVFGRPNIAYKTWYLNTNSMHFADDYVTTVTTRSTELLYWRGWMSIHIHNIDEQGGATGVAAHLDAVKAKEGDLWVGLWKDVARYGQSRDTHTLTVTQKTAQAVHVTVTDSMNDAVFDYPLTVKVRVDNGWADITATQDGQPVPATVVHNNNNQYVLVKAVPDGGEVVLTPGSTAIKGQARPALAVPGDLPTGAWYNCTGQKVADRQPAPGLYLRFNPRTGIIGKVLIVR